MVELAGKIAGALLADSVIVVRHILPSWFDERCFGVSVSIEALSDDIKSVLDIHAGNMKSSKVSRVTLEEALFLCYERGLLEIRGTADNSLPSDLWTHFCKSKPKFFELYMCFRYFRLKGWVVKSGLNYGVDYVVYRGDPDKYHSDHCILVRPMPDSLRWASLQRMTRLMPDIAKSLLLCTIVPSSLRAGVASSSSLPPTAHIGVDEKKTTSTFYNQHFGGFGTDMINYEVKFVACSRSTADGGSAAGKPQRGPNKLKC